MANPIADKLQTQGRPPGRGQGPQYPVDQNGNRTDPGAAPMVDARKAAATSKAAKATAAKVAAKKAASTKAAAAAAAKNKAGDWSKWFHSGAPNAPAGPSPWDPLAGMPGMTPLTPYPSFNYDSLPDGSSVPDDPAHAFQSNKAALLDPSKWSDLVGGKAYQPIIDALTKNIGGLQNGIGQANDMMDKGYGDAANTALAGAQSIREGTATSNLGLTDLAARMAQAAGGDPLAAAAVGQATANQQGFDTRQASDAAQSQVDQATAAQRDLAIAKLGYKGATDTAISDLISKKGAAQTEASQTKGKGIMDALGFNSDQKTAQQGRDTSAQEAWLAGQLAGPEITAKRLANEGSRQALMLNKHGASVDDWSRLNTAQQQHFTTALTRWTDKNVAKQASDALAAGKQPKAEIALTDPSAFNTAEGEILGRSYDSKGNPLVDPGKMYYTALNAMKAQYTDSNPMAIKKLALLFATRSLNVWNSEHAKGQAVTKKTWKIVNGAPALVKK